MSIAMSQGMRNVVYSLVDMQDQINTANERLSTGKKVNNALDNASAYFRSQSYRKESRDLAGLLDFMDSGLRAITKITNSLDSARQLIEAAQSFARQAVSLATSDVTGRDAYGTQAAELMNQAAKILNDSGFGGTSLLQTNATNPAALTILTNVATAAAGQTSITINSTDVRFGVASGVGSAVLGSSQGMTIAGGTAGVQEAITYTATATDRWSDGSNGNTRANAFVTFTQNAITKLQSTGGQLSAQAAAIQVRKDFTKSWIRVNEEAADYLTLADMNEEGANLSALQTKQQLAVQALQLANRSDQAILRLF